MSSSSKTMEKKHNVSIHWFRNGLRLHDNPPLLDACHNSNTLLPIYIIDPSAPFAQTPNRKAGTIRANFLLESIKDMDDKLKKRGSRMIVLLGKAEEILPKVCKQMKVDALYYEREPAAPVREADSLVLDAIREISKDKDDVEIVGYDTHTLHPMEHYLAKCKGQVAPSSYGVFTKMFEKMDVPEEADTVSDVPPLPSSSLDKLQSIQKDTMDCPTLKDLGYTDEKKLKKRGKGGLEFLGGEDAGLELLNTMMSRTRFICTFEKPKTEPNALTVDTTGLSAYVKHGCISPRKFYHELSKVYDKYPANKLSKPPVSLHGQLMWREYNNLMGYTTPNFDQMIDNPVARQIPWDDDPELLLAWKEGRTGYPFIDAIMTQLRETGWIHHLARHAVACFLTRGDLWQSWECGAAVFEEELIDADWSINNFNWQWLSCTAHFYQYFRCYSPVAFGKKTDKNGDYIRKWLPQFKDYPAKYIYEPWTAPLSVQESCGVIIGEDYPEPIVEHKSVSKSNMGRMKVAYDAAKAQAEAEAKAAPKKKATTRKASTTKGAAKKRARTVK